MDLFKSRFPRITINGKGSKGQPCIKEVPVASILGHFAAGLNQDAVLQQYPILEKEDIAEALAFASIDIEDPSLLAQRSLYGLPAGLYE